MKNLTTKSVIALAALVAACGVASAQSMQAKVPFAFRANGKLLAPGTYVVNANRGSSPIVSIASRQPGQQALAVAMADDYPKKAWTDAGGGILAFQCSVSSCVLTSVWMGQSGPVYRLPAVGLGKEEPTHTAEIQMHPLKAY